MRRPYLLAALLSLAACSPRPDGSESPPASAEAGGGAQPTQRERDSVLARSKIPMAGAVGKAMGAADAASAQAAAHDSLLH